MVLIAILAFLVLGVLVAAEAPRTATDTNASFRENANPAAVQHASSNKSSAPAIDGRSGSGNLARDVMSGHHSS